MHANVYVRIFSQLDIREFTLTQLETFPCTCIQMKEILRDLDSVIYYGNTSFLVIRERMSFVVDFDRSLAPSFCFFSSREHSALGESYPQFNVKEGEQVFTCKNALILEDDCQRAVWASIELQCYARYDDV